MPKAETEEPDADRVERLSTLAWRRKAGAGGAQGMGIKKQAPINPAAPLIPIVDPVVPGEDRVLRRAISSNRPDRYGDVVHQDGMDITNYHGIVAWGHDTSGSCGGPPMMPVGKTLRFERMQQDGYDLTIAYCQFAGMAEGNPWADTTYLMAKAGFLPDSSIGFDPKADGYVRHDDGTKEWFDFTGWDLVEWSVVPVGANTDAVQMAFRAKAAGIDLQPLDEFCRLSLDAAHGEEGLWVPRATLEAVVKALGYGRGLKLFELRPAEIRAEVSRKVRALPVPQIQEAGAVPAALAAEIERQLDARAPQGEILLRAEPEKGADPWHAALTERGITPDMLATAVVKMGEEQPVAETATADNEPPAAPVADAPPPDAITESADDPLDIELAALLEPVEADPLESAILSLGPDDLKALGPIINAEVGAAMRQLAGRLD